MMSRSWAWVTMLSVVAWLAVVGPSAAAAPLSDAQPALEELGRKLVDTSRPKQERLDIIAAFARWATDQVRPPLLAALKDPDPDVRAAAARALGWAGNREAIDGLRAVAETPGEAPGVRAGAIHALGVIADRSVRPRIVAAADDPHGAVREAALSSVALGALVDPKDRTALLIKLMSDRAIDAQLRSDAARSLGHVKEPGVAEALIQVLESEPRSTIALPKSNLTREQVMLLRYAQARDVAAWAAGALGELDAKQALPLILKSAEDPQDYFLRLVSIQTLVSWNPPEAREVYVRRLDDPLADNRAAALAGLARLGDPAMADAALPKLSDESSVVRAQAVAALTLLGGPKVRPALEAMQKTESNSDVLNTLQEALARLPR